MKVYQAIVDAYNEGYKDGYEEAIKELRAYEAEMKLQKWIEDRAMGDEING